MTFKWDDSFTPQLGKMTDAALAEQAGCSPWVVARRRKELGIPAFSARQERAGKSRSGARLWTKAEDAELGKHSDASVAAMLGRTKTSVLQRRQRLGIASARFSATAHVIKITEDMRRFCADVEPALIDRYRKAGFPVAELQPWQIIDIALRELHERLLSLQSDGPH